MSRVDPPDEVVVDRAVRDPEPPEWLTREERRLAGQRLLGRGATAADVARRFGVAPRTVHRWRAERQPTRKAA